MKVSKSWLKKLVELNCSIEELVKLLPLRTIGTKEVTNDFIELDMKGYNRADLLSMRGVAYEVAAITGSRVLFEEPQEGDFVWNTHKLPNTPVRIMENNLAEVQCVAKIEGLTLDKSPEEWVKKLESCGIRQVNNIADVTNLIMLEYGQPLHSFDAKSIENDTINVRRAKDGEEITTLDHKLRKLTSDDIVLADTKKALDVAGVMGGLDTEVNENTTTILLSASIFNPEMTRNASQGLGLQSEASNRFYHGLTKKRLLQALNAAIKMYKELGGKLSAVTLVGNLGDNVKKINLSQEKLNNLVGVKIPKEKIDLYLKSLGFHLGGGGTNSWEVTIPYWRLDVNIEEDVIEEVARMYGYEKIPAEKVSESKPLQEEDPIFQQIYNLRENLVKAGLTEMQTYSFYSTPVIEALGIKKEKLIKIANPISSETEYLRENLWPNLLEVVDRNLRKGFKDIAIFEIGKVFENKDGDPSENYKLAIVLCNESDNPMQELYQILQGLNLHLGGGKLNKTLFHPKRQTDNLAEVHLRVLNKLGIEKRVAVLEVEIIKPQ